jgi:hypothetical protein
MKLITVVISIFILNIPFGYWRRHVRRRSFQWFLAIHTPVPFVVAIRFAVGIEWRLHTAPFLLGSFFLGQFIGGRIYQWLKINKNIAVSSCLFCDIVHWYKLKLSNERKI